MNPTTRSRTISLHVIPGIIIAAAFFLRVWDLGRNSLWYDEILQVQAVAGSLEHLYNELIVNAAMPLDYLIERGMLALGANEMVLRFPAAVFGTLAVVVLYQLGRAMFGTATGVLAAAFLAVSGFAVFYAHEARPYSVQMFFVLFAAYWLYRALTTNTFPHWLFFGLFVAGATLTHLFALFFILTLLLFLILGLLVRVIAPRRAELFSRISRVAVAGGVLVLLLFLGALWLTPNAQFVWGSSLRFFAFLFNPQFLPREQWFGVAPGETPPLPTFDFFYTRILENFSGGGLVPTLLFTGLGLVGLASFPRKPWETFLLALWTILPSALIVLFLGHRGNFFAARYLIAALPAWLLLCAVGAHTLGTLAGQLRRNNPLVRRAAILGVALVFIAFGLERSTVAIAAPKEDWRAAGQILDANAQPGDAVMTPGGTKVVYFYARQAAAAQHPAETAAEISAASNTVGRMWLVLNRYVFDPGGEIEAWLQGHGAVPLRADSGITVYYWRPNADTAALLEEAKSFQLPSTSYAYLSLGEQFAANGDKKTARSYFTRALSFTRSAAESSQVITAWGDAARRAGDLDEAAQKYRSALAWDNSQFRAWLGLGRVYLEQGQLFAAQDTLTRALALEPTSYPALYFLAETYERSGQDASAQQYYARAAEINPELITPP